MYRRLIIVRHGQSIWNLDSKFTGWTDIPLTKVGEQEAVKMAEKMKQHNLTPKVIFTSALTRSLQTSEIIKQGLYDFDIPVLPSWRLNEKHYGRLEGVPRQYIRELYGMEYTKRLRRDFYMLPPLIRDKPHSLTSPTSQNYPIYRNKYYDTIKDGESKENVYNRVIPFFNRFIMPCVEKGDLPLMVTHKHTIRVLMKYIQGITDEDFQEYNIPANKIMCIVFDENNNFRSVTYYKYLI